MKGLWSPVDSSELLVGDLESILVAALVQARFEVQSLVRPGVADKIDNHGVAHQRLPTPVLGDVAEHPVLDLVPLAGAGRKVADRNRQAGLVGQLLQAELP